METPKELTEITVEAYDEAIQQWRVYLNQVSRTVAVLCREREDLFGVQDETDTHTETN